VRVPRRPGGTQTGPALSTATRLAWGITLLSLTLVVASVVLLALDWPAIGSTTLAAQLPGFLNAVITGVLGVLIATRRPRNPIGWLLIAIAATDAIALPSDFLAIRGLLAGASPRSWVEWPAWVGGGTGGPNNGALFGLLVLFFPDGRLPGSRWRPVAWLVVVLAVMGAALARLSPDSVQLSPRLPSVPNPVGVALLAGASGGAGVAGLVNAVSLLLFLLLLAVALVVRFRRSRGVERQQLRWFARVGVIAVGVMVAGAAIGAANQPVVQWRAVASDALWNAGLEIGLVVGLPATIGLAVIKDGLYDIDLFLSRTVVYGSLAVFITAVYVGIAVGIGSLVGSGGRPNLGLSILATAIVAVGFQPVRERVQRVANRLVYGERATPYEVLSQFSGRVAETYAADQVLPRMARVLREGSGAETAVVWLRSEGRMLPAASYPEPVGLGALEVTGDLLPEVPGSDRAVAVEHQGELLGALSVVKRRGESLTPMEMKLIDDLAHQAGLVLKNVGLTAELMRRLDELRFSRQRLVQAQDEERRRLERNLHDGAQQHLVALKVKLGLVNALTEKNPEQATAMLEQLQGDADEALETLRDLARGIYPPLLADKGLAAALESQARRATLPVEVDADGISRYSPEVEATVYFCALEALQNVQKYADASRAAVRLGEAAGELRFEVEDDGCGFEVAAVKEGSGLTNMADRLDAVGGRLDIDSEPGQGSRLTGTVPIQSSEAAGAAV
jgi:signal transduction histidine kinase